METNAVQFQFTRARGARPMSLDKSVKGHRVSIHARTGRATSRPVLGKRAGGFNSRAHGARDRLKIIYRLILAQFQFTRARGARLYRDIRGLLLWWFQFTRARGARRRCGI